MSEIEYAHKDVSFQRVRHSVTGRTFPKKKPEDFLASYLQRHFNRTDEFPFKGTAIISLPMDIAIKAGSAEYFSGSLVDHHLKITNTGNADDFSTVYPGLDPTDTFKVLADNWGKHQTDLVGDLLFLKVC